MNEPILEVQRLKKYFRTAAGFLHAVDDVSFSIGRGQTMGVVGESGCGKSTLGRTILQLHEPSAGKIFFSGREVTGLSKRAFKDVRPKMQMIFQDPYSSLNGRMTVSQLIAEPLIVNKFCRSSSEIDERVEEMMDTVGLAKRLALSYPHELDGGRRQRIGIARALILRPEFVVCDEPVSALDVSIQAQILNLLGRCVEKAPAREIFLHPVHPYTKALLAAIPIPDISSKHKHRELLQGEVTSPVNPKPGCRFAARCPMADDRCRSGEIPLMELRPGHFAACLKAESDQLNDPVFRLREESV